jgi:hypothetical protein
MRQWIRGGGWGLYLAVALALIALLSAGCQPAGGATHTVAGDTPFYLDGPQQARPADGTLAAGARVTLVSVAGSYAQVVMPDGRRAYVAADSLKPLR